ncbi:hypothetical protein BU23DRAFT_601189 [Bimuria novae-zelandiae CBS 107.79]|uniref:Uncharacterized protein n=1 Tax=Bimuria novae-zelandiae CBS 107.79 TaxID=1447943 RepID=A0A6A5V1V4_9PLEO|nr:hypothetical protein BU23DRAFT_601189 [Bimuria novae-zelandiae CBS 107.79]
MPAFGMGEPFEPPILSLYHMDLRNVSENWYLGKTDCLEMVNCDTTPQRSIAAERFVQRFIDQKAAANDTPQLKNFGATRTPRERVRINMPPTSCDGIGCFGHGSEFGTVLFGRYRTYTRDLRRKVEALVSQLGTAFSAGPGFRHMHTYDMFLPEYPAQHSPEEVRTCEEVLREALAHIHAILTAHGLNIQPPPHKPQHRHCPRRPHNPRPARTFAPTPDGMKRIAPIHITDAARRDLHYLGGTHYFHFVDRKAILLGCEFLRPAEQNELLQAKRLQEETHKAVVRKKKKEEEEEEEEEEDAGRGKASGGRA